MLFILVTFLCYSALKIQEAGGCKTPKGQNGNCISIYNCQELLDALATFNDSAIQYAKESQCGYAKTALVCCPSKIQTNIESKPNFFNKAYCGYQHADDYYTNNRHKANIDEFPWLASLLYSADNGKKEIKCGGSLISDQYILTAAHCIITHYDTLVGVRLGEYNLHSEKDCTGSAESEDCTDPTVEYNIQKTIVYQNYSLRTKSHDIGLIKLNTTVSYSDFIRPICLPFPEVKLAQVGDVMLTSGWGNSKFGGLPVNIKKKAFVKLVSLDECKKIYESINRRVSITDKQTCTRTTNSSEDVSCSGDSGNPVMFSNNNNQWHVESIISFGTLCGTTTPDVNTNVVKYLDWILENIKA